MANIQALNGKLSAQPYVSGFVPSKDDATAFKEMFGGNTAVMQWAARMASYYQSDRDHILDPEAAAKKKAEDEDAHKKDERNTKYATTTHWIDSVADTTWYCEHILQEAPLNRWCEAPVQATQTLKGAAVSVDGSSKVVALDLEGINLSRTGEITVISVATDKAVYLFDVVAVGAEGVAVLAHFLLENPAVLKVLFDLRQDCDSLYHQFGHCLVHPVCDLQVSCVLFLFPPTRRRNLIGMAKCFKERLHLFSEEELAVKQRVGLKTFDNKAGDSLLWKRRPIDEDLITYSAIDVKHMFSAMEILIKPRSQLTSQTPSGTVLHEVHSKCSSNVIQHGITIGCQRRDRAVTSAVEVPHSAECDFKDLLDQAGEEPAAGAKREEGGDDCVGEQ